MVSRNGTTVDWTVPQRVDWVDYAKGICIVMVVMMHSTLGVEAAAGREGFMHLLVAFAKPFRMPDFFLISGLFLARVIDRDWRTYLDRKVVHFVYFYVLWLTIQFLFKAPAIAADGGLAHVGREYLFAFIEPFGTLWFIYMLPVFFVVTRLTRGLPSWAIWVAAAGLEAMHVTTGWTLIDEFAARFVYFYSGYLFANGVFGLSDRAGRNPEVAIAALAAWGVTNALAVNLGISQWPGVSLLLGFAGAIAVVITATLLAQARAFDALRFCGKNSIVIYLAFFLPMATTRTVLLKSGLITDTGVVALIVTAAGVVGALAIWWLARRAGATFLFTRPAAFHLTPARPRALLQAAE